MHNHNGNNKSMIWMMLPCILLMGFILLGGNKLSSSKYLWLIIVGVCVVPHLWMMFKGHGKCNDKDTNMENKTDDNKDKHNSCCH